MSQNDENQADRIKAHIIQSLDDGLDFTVQSSRTASIKRFCEKYPNEKYKSVSAVHGSLLAKIVKERGGDPSNYKQSNHAKKKYDKSLDPSMDATITKNPADIPAPVRGRGIGPNWREGQPQQEGEAPLQAGPQVSSETIGAFCSSLWNVARYFKDGLEPFTPDEKSDLGVLGAPLVQGRVQSERAMALLFVGGAAGIIMNKMNMAKATQKARESKTQTKPTPPQDPFKKAEPTPPPAEAETPTGEPGPDMSAYYGSIKNGDDQVKS